MNPIQATFEQGVFRPTTPVELPEGCRVELSIVPAVDHGVQTPTSTSAVEQSIEEKLGELAQSVPPDTWEQLPADLSDRIDHYVYGIE